MGYNNYNLLGAAPATASAGLGALIWAIITLVVSIVGCFVIYFLFVKKDNKISNKFLEWLREFLSFRKMFIEDIIKITYIFGALFITLGSFSLIGVSFLSFVAALIGGNLLLRVVYELSIMTIMIWKNTNDINKKLK